MMEISLDENYERKTLPQYISIVWSAIRKGCKKQSDFAKYELPNHQTILDNMVNDGFLEHINNKYKIPGFKDLEKVNFFRSICC